MPVPPPEQEDALKGNGKSGKSQEILASPASANQVPGDRLSGRSRGKKAMAALPLATPVDDITLATGGNSPHDAGTEGEAALPVSDKRTAILSASQKIFAEKGLADANVSEIAREAGVTDSIIYHYFKGKEDLLFCLLAEKMHEAMRNLTLHLKGIFDPASKLGKMIWFHLFIIDKSPGETRVMKNLLLECRSNKNFYSHPGYNSLRKYTGFLLSILRNGIEEEVFSRDLNAPLARDMIFGFLDEMSLSCLATPEQRQALPDFDDVMALILPMISSSWDQASGGQENDKAARILQAAEYMFAEKGYLSATMAEVAAMAGVAEGTIYSYFKNKKELLFSLPRKRFEDIRASIRGVFQPGGVHEKFLLLIRHHFLLLLANRNFLKVFLTDIKLNRQFYLSDSYPLSQQYVDILDEILEEGKQQGVFRASVNPRLFRHLFLGTFSHLAMRWFVVGSNRSTDKCLEIEHAAVLLYRAVANNSPLSSANGQAAY